MIECGCQFVGAVYDILVALRRAFLLCDCFVTFITYILTMKLYSECQIT